MVHRAAEDGPVLLTARAAIVVTMGGLMGAAVAWLTFLGDHGLAAARRGRRPSTAAPDENIGWWPHSAATY
ncbi:hypothetical protein AB0E66_28280 [Streptomyces sp. NPDC033753]|uniref:hypothetical protein n=1 Tax=Streptomyces sp. NPDC033753 TaxID=3155128 RepID=UPI0033C4227F